jgi:hypothetical protein
MRLLGAWVTTRVFNLVAVSAAPFGGGGGDDELPIDTGRSFLEVTRFPAPTAG